MEASLSLRARLEAVADVVVEHLRVDRVEPGAPTMAAIAELPPSQSTAHVRPTATNAETAGRGSLFS